MTDSKYFTTNKKGEIFELKAELNNEKKEKRKEAVKKVIAAMTVGKDVRRVRQVSVKALAEAVEQNGEVPLGHFFIPPADDSVTTSGAYGKLEDR